MSDKSAIERAADAVGGATKLAELLGESIQTIGNWKVRGVPIKRCHAIEQVTDGAVTRIELRPDDWQEIWPELAPTGRKTARA